MATEAEKAFCVLCWPPRSPDLTPCGFSYGDMLRTCLSTDSTTGSAWAAKTNIAAISNRSWHAAADTGGNGLSAWRLPCHKGRTHRALMRHAKKNIFGEFLFLYVGRMLQSFPPFKCTHFMKYVREFWITLYISCWFVSDTISSTWSDWPDSYVAVDLQE